MYKLLEIYFMFPKKLQIKLAWEKSVYVILLLKTQGCDGSELCIFPPAHTRTAL